MTLEDALAFYGTYYSPNNAILIVAGDVTPDEVKRLAEQYYGVIPANPDLPERVRAQEPDQMAERRMVFEDPRVAQPYVARSYLAPERDSGAQEEAAALTMLAEILGGGTTSVMAEKLQFDAQIAVQSGAWYSGLSLDDTTFNVYVVPTAGVSLQEAEDAMDQVIADFMKDGIDPEHLERIRMQIRAALIYEQDNVSTIANEYGRSLSQGLTVEDVQAWPEILKAVTEEDIMAAAAKVFNRDNAVTGWLRAPEVTQ